MNLVIMFALLCAVAVTVVATSLMAKVSGSYLQALEDKARITTADLSMVLADPFAMGEYDHMEKIIAAAKTADPDLAYAIIMSSDGRAVATTDPAFKNAKLASNEYETSALKVTEYIKRQGNGGDGSAFETVMPITASGQKAGVLRLGFAANRAAGAMSDATTSVCLVAFIAVLISTLIFAAIIKNWAPAPATTPTA